MSGTPTPRELRETSNLTAGPWTARRSLGLARRESEEFARLLQKVFHRATRLAFAAPIR